MASLDARLTDLERKADPALAPRIVICWDIDPAPAPPGVKVVTWPPEDPQPGDIVWRIVYASEAHED